MFPEGEIVLDNIKNVLDLDMGRDMGSGSIDYSVHFMNKGVDTEYDNLVDKYDGSFIALEVIREKLNKKILKKESSSGRAKKSNQLVKLHKTDKMGYSLIGYKKTSRIIKRYYKKI